MTDILDGASVVSMLGGGALVAFIQAAGRAYTRRTDRAEGIDSVLANALAHEQQAHTATRTELSQARTAEALALTQAATFGAQVESLVEWRVEMDKRLADADERIADAETRSEECEMRYAALQERVRRVEKRVTPVDTQAVDTDVRVRPMMSESVGGIHER